MSSLRKSMINPLPIIPTTISSNFTLTLSLKLPRSTLSTWQKWKLVKPSSKNTLRQDKLYPQNPPKPLPSSLYQRRMESYAHVKITATWTPTQSKMPILSPLSLNSSMTWRDPPCLPNSTFAEDTTISTSKKKTNGRLPSSLPWGCLNPLSCFSDSATLPPHFKHSWTTSLWTCWGRSG